MIKIEDLSTGLAIAVIAGVLAFLGGILLAEPIKNKLSEWRRIIKIKTSTRKKIPVSVFFIHSPFCSDQLSQLLLQQNRLQTMFEFELTGYQTWPGRTTSDNTLKSFRTKSRLEFCEKFQAEINKYFQQTDRQNCDHISIAITELPFPKNFYTWNTRDRKVIVIGIDSLRYLFQGDTLVVNKIILRVIQRMLVYSLNIEGLKTHEATRGCLFDLTPLLTDIQYSVDNIYICKECKQALLKDRDNLRILDGVNEWISNTSK